LELSTQFVPTVRGCQDPGTCVKAASILQGASLVAVVALKVAGLNSGTVATGVSWVLLELLVPLVPLRAWRWLRRVWGWSGGHYGEDRKRGFGVFVWIYQSRDMVSDQGIGCPALNVPKGQSLLVSVAVYAETRRRK